MQKLCRGCGEIKDLKDFYKNISSPIGVTSRCQLCVNRSNKLRYRKAIRPRIKHNIRQIDRVIEELKRNGVKS